MSLFPVELCLSRLHWPVTTLGYGRRVGIWFQGCSIRCKGCCSQDTWDADASSVTTVDTVPRWIAGLPVHEVDGFTISGGEPFDQPAALFNLTAALRRIYCADGKRDILLYSGYPWRKLCSRHADLLQLVDAVISEPYVAERPLAFLRGSDNQSLHLRSELARARYGPDLSGKCQESIQIHFDGKALWMIGIPRPGDLDRLQKRLETSGISLGGVSWRS